MGKKLYERAKSGGIPDMYKYIYIYIYKYKFIMISCTWVNFDRENDLYIIYTISLLPFIYELFEKS